MTIPNQIKKNNVIKQDFSYQKENCHLQFTLRLDIKNELKCFKELLETALLDVEKELYKHEAVNLLKK